jgi:hypothetical protein
MPLIVQREGPLALVGELWVDGASPRYMRRYCEGFLEVRTTFVGRWGEDFAEVSRMLAYIG